MRECVGIVLPRGPPCVSRRIPARVRPPGSCAPLVFSAISSVWSAVPRPADVRRRPTHFGEVAEAARNAMSYAFFLSYARADRDEYLRRFHDDLAKLVRGMTGRAEDRVSFSDGEVIEPGEVWEDRLARALQTTSIMVSLCSPTYFQRPYCAREWRVFTDRVARYHGGLPADSERPPLLIPLVWYPAQDKSVPDVVAELQHGHDDFGEAYRENGLQYLLRQKAKHDAEYQDLLTRLARWIVDRGRTHPMPPLGGLPKLGDLPDTF